MKLIFDFGMYDAADTEYYLESGYKVVAVEANPALARAARAALGPYITSGQLEIINAAISADSGDVELTISGDDLASSSTLYHKVESRIPLATFKVQGITTQTLLDRFGVPYYFKIDIEGADKLAVFALSAATKPNYISFEIGEDFEPLLDHLSSIGFKQFRAVNQCNLRELSDERNLLDRFSLKLIGALGYRSPQYAKRSGRYFRVGYSSGPGPWKAECGWRSKEELLRLWRGPKASDQKNVWYDLHAK